MMAYDAYLDAWAATHAFERARMGPVLRTYLRLPYALARPLTGVSPHAVTLLGVAVAWATVGLYAAGWAFVAGALVLVAGLLDSVDGAVAVLRGRVTAFGAVWDSTADRLADLALYLGPALWAPGARWWLAAAAAGTFLLEYVRARCQANGWTDRQVVTPGERPTRVVAVAVLGMASPLVGRWVWVPGAALVAGLTLVGVALLLRDARGRSTTPASG